jgi:hypothetical protein
MPREITYSIGTEYTSGPSRGYYNPTYMWNDIGTHLNYLGYYWDISFRRVGANGRIRVLQANKNPSHPGIAAWQNGLIIRIAPEYNFYYHNLLCARVICHEFGHTCRQGAGHAKSPGLMDPNSSLPTGQIAEVDYWWFDVYPRKAGAPRPHTEPGQMAKVFAPNRAVQRMNDVPSPYVFKDKLDSLALPEFGCNHSNRAWYDFRPQSWITP